MNLELVKPELSADQFDHIRQLLYQLCRIDLKPGKENLVEGRLIKRLRQLGLDDFDAYIRYLDKDRTGGERAFMVDALTTNKTSFFREDQHFDYLRQQLLPQLKEKGTGIRFWCAGCSSGEEPYTLSMVLHEAWPHIEHLDVRILATDISDTALAAARRAVYGPSQVEEVPPVLRHKHFVRSGKQTPTFQMAEWIRHPVSFAALNLMGSWPMQGPFDAIFCRNVMIYFDRPTQEQLVRRFYELLGPGGHFFISHSESLTGLSHSFQYVQPAVYRREE